MNNKTDFRIKAKSIRKGLDIDKISAILCEKIQQNTQYQMAKNVLFFYPLEYEINLLELVRDEKKFYLPRVNGDNLEICPYNFGDYLKQGKFKTKEPITKPVDISIIDLIILPALAADKNNYRLGYGKGYYDRLLSQSDTFTILPLPKALIFEKIPTEPHDKKVNLIITD